MESTRDYAHAVKNEGANEDLYELIDGFRYKVYIH
jgi:hypothetical protein